MRVAPQRSAPTLHHLEQGVQGTHATRSFHRTRGETLARMSRRSSSVAPDGANPVDVFTKSAPAASTACRPADDLVLREIGVLEDDLDQRPATGGLDDRTDVVLDPIRSAPDLSQPMLMTMSSSVAPSASACPTSKTLVAVWWLPCGKPMTVPTATSGAAQQARCERHVCRPDARRSDVVTGRELAALPDLVERELGTKERVVDRLRDALIRDVGDGEVRHAGIIASPIEACLDI